MSLATAMDASKKALRKTIKTSLKSISNAEVQAQSRQITAHLIQSSLFKRSRSISCYLSMPSGEVDTNDVVESILQAGKTLYVPKVVHPNVSQSSQPEMHMLRVYNATDLQSIRPGTWDIREPEWEWSGGKRASALDPPQEHPPLELILIPGVAFDPTLSRIGHGKGYYDRFISLASSHALRHERPRPMLVALALREQLLKPGEIPMVEHDWKVDAIITPDGVVAGDAGQGEEAVVEAQDGTKGGRIGLAERSNAEKDS